MVGPLLWWLECQATKVLKAFAAQSLNSACYNWIKKPYWEVFNHFISWKKGNEMCISQHYLLFISFSHFSMVSSSNWRHQKNFIAIINVDKVVLYEVVNSFLAEEIELKKNLEFSLVVFYGFESCTNLKNQNKT